MTPTAISRHTKILISILLILCLAQAVVLVFLLNRKPDCRLQGIAVYITDGDTFTLDLGSATRKIRLSEIDTPELNQPYGTQAKQLLSDWISGKAVQVRDEGPDKYGRTLGRVAVGGVDINAELVKQGAAWVYRQYSRDASLLPLETVARTEKRGLWELAEPIAPWDWRKGKKSEVRSGAERSAGCQPDKISCKDMSSCDEAKFYLKNCGLGKLDRDGDGIPCETLCRGS